MIGIILAAGNGSRLKNSENENICKPLANINGVPLITFSLENLLRLETDRVCIVVGKEGAFIKQTLGTSYKGLALHYVLQPEPRGLIHGFMQVLKVLDPEESVLLQLSDEIFVDLHAEEIMSNIHADEYDFICGMVLEENPEKIKGNYSVEMDADGRFESCTEKPQEVTNQMKGTGFCYFNARTLALLRMRYDETANSPSDLCGYMNLLIREGFRGLLLQVAEKEFNINTAVDLDEVRRALCVN